jgi:RNA polymerase sigma-70 factor (ECF subfamily)
MDDSKPAAFALDGLATHAGWLRELARHLVDDRASADDLVQDAYVAAMRSPPDPERPARPWLAQVIRNLHRSGRRGQRRRLGREREVGTSSEQPPTADEVLARTQLIERMAALLRALEEPYRATLMLRFFEGRDSKQIGALYGIPAGTVRWRINEGLRRLRERLDDAHQGRRQEWRVLLFPVSGQRDLPPVPWLATAALPGALLVVAVAGVTLVRVQAPEREMSRVEHAAVAAPPAPKQREETNMMTAEQRRRLGTLVGAALPALIAGSHAAADPVDPGFLDAAADHCVQMREKVFECKDAFAQAFVDKHNPPPERRAAMLARTLEEIVADGSGPLPPRKKACEQTVQKMLRPENEKVLRDKLEGMRKLLAFCAAKSDCAERVECMVPFFPPGKGVTAAPAPANKRPR